MNRSPLEASPIKGRQKGSRSRVCAGSKSSEILRTSQWSPKQEHVVGGICREHETQTTTLNPKPRKP